MKKILKFLAAAAFAVVVYQLVSLHRKRRKMVEIVDTSHDFNRGIPGWRWQGLSPCRIQGSELCGFPPSATGVAHNEHPA